MSVTMKEPQNRNCTKRKKQLPVETQFFRNFDTGISHDHRDQ